jgi:hypothetical protein
MKNINGSGTNFKPRFNLTITIYLCLIYFTVIRLRRIWVRIQLVLLQSDAAKTDEQLEGGLFCCS